MTFDEYNKKIDEYVDRMVEVFRDVDLYHQIYRELSEFQNDYMQNVLKEYKKTVGDDRAKEICYELLSYAVNDSESGNAIVDIDDEETARKVDEILYEELGDYLLDENENVYQESDGQWVANVMFGGSYIPGWDGWSDVVSERRADV